MIVIIQLAFLVTFAADIRAELKLISVVFRHGDRAPDNTGLETYPTDPYKNESYYPMGPGGLTNEGKMREYFLGYYLRETYNDFLGKAYYSGIVNARSTFVERTRQCVQLVLAALFPPKGDQIWFSKLMWQPIPTNFIPHIHDTLMFPQECPRYFQAISKVLESAEYQEKEQKFHPLMKNLTEWTGEPVINSPDLYFLYHTLAGALELDMEPPAWAEGIFPDGLLHDGALFEYDLISWNDELKRLNGGMLLRKIIDDMAAVCEGRQDNTKVFLYSGHEFNVAALLQALGTYKLHIPAYSSAVILELHKEDQECFVQVRYYKGKRQLVVKNEEQYVEKMTIPGCTDKCPLNQFKELLKNRTATDDDIKDCNKRNVPEVLKTLKNYPVDNAKWVQWEIENEKKNPYVLQ